MLALLKRAYNSPALGVGIFTLVLLAIAHWASFGLTNADTFFHLRAGQEILSGAWHPGAMGHFGPLDSDQWTSTQWFPQVAMAWLVAQGGLPLLMVASMGVYLLFFLSAYFILRSYGPPVAVGLGLAAFAWSQGSYLTVRPQLWSFLLMLALTHLWLKASKQNRIPWLAIPLLALWANLHGMWIAGLVNCFVLAGAHVLDQRTRGSLKVLCVPFFATLATLLTPAGLNLWKATVNALLTGAGKSGFYTEWGPPSYTDVYSAVAFLLFVAVALVFASRSSTNWTEKALLFLMLGWAVWSIRSVPLAFLMGLVLLLHRTAGPAARVALKELVGVGLAAVLAFGAFTAMAPANPTYYIGIPSWVDTRLASLPADTVVYTSFREGSYSLYAHPQLTIFIHGYVDAFTDEEEQLMEDLIFMLPQWDQKLEATGATYALWHPKSPVAYNLQLQGWTVVQGDENFLLLAAPAEVPAASSAPSR